MGDLRPAVPIVMAAWLAGPGCGVDERDLASWKRAENGPGRIRAVLSDAEQPVDLRAAAALALVEIGRVDDLTGDLLALPVDDSRRVGDRATPGLVRRMKEIGAEPAGVWSKDTLFTIRERLTPLVRRGAEAAIVDWLCADLAGRARLGTHDADGIVTALQTAAALPLLRVLGGRDTDVADASRLLRAIDYPSIRPRAADLLVARARRERPPSRATLMGMATIGGAHVAGALADLAAGDPSATGEEAFRALQEISRDGDDAGRRALLDLASSANEAGRWRAIRAIVDSGDAEALARLLDTLPETSLRTPFELRDQLLAPLLHSGAAVLPTLRGALRAHSTAGRLVAVRLLGDLGTAEDGSALAALRADPARLPGASGLPTVGAEAQAAEKRLHARLR